MRDFCEKMAGWGITILLAISLGYLIHIILDHIKSKTELNRSSVEFLNRSSFNIKFNSYRNPGDHCDVR